MPQIPSSPKDPKGGSASDFDEQLRRQLGLASLAPDKMLDVLSRTLHIPLAPAGIELVEFDAATRDRQLVLLRECRRTAEEAVASEWSAQRLERDVSILEQLVTSTARAYIGSPAPDQPIPASAIPVSLAYWASIDVNVHTFRAYVRWLLSDRVQAFLSTQSDVRTGLVIVRQIAELAIHAVACQWVIEVFYNQMKRSAEQLRQYSLLSSQEFESFTLAIAYWNRKYTKMLSAVLGREFPMDENHGKMPCDPTTDKLFQVVEFLLGKISERSPQEGGELQEHVDELKKVDHFTCKFVHPTPAQFPLDGWLHPDSRFPTDRDIRQACALAFLGVVEHSYGLLSRLFFSPANDAVSFVRLMVPAAVAHSGPASAGDIPAEFAVDFLSRYKPEIVIQTTSGPVTVVKHR